MKKLMFALVAGACATVMAEGEITSANVVGYAKMDAKDSENPESFASYYSGGSCFSVVGQDGATWKLGDLKQSGGAAMEDTIQFLDVSSANTYLTATYVTADEDEELVGWWDIDEDREPGDKSLDGQTFAAGTAFLAAITSEGSLGYTGSGEVVKGSKQIVIPAGTAYPFVCNPLPKDVTLGQITMVNTAAIEDTFQFLNGTSANTWKTVTYVTADEDEELVGWWDIDEDREPGDLSADSVILNPGQGILGAFTSGSSMSSDVTMTFPSAY